MTLSRMDGGRQCRWEGGIWLIKEAFLTPPLFSHYWHLKARIHISCKLWCCVQMWSCVSRECFHQQNSDGRKWACDTQQTIIYQKVSSADVLPTLPLHQHLLSIGFLPLLPHAKKWLIFYLVFPEGWNKWAEERKSVCLDGTDFHAEKTKQAFGSC